MASIKARIHGMFFMTMSVIAVEGWFGIAGLDAIQERIQRASDQLIPLSRTISRLETVQTQQHNQFAKALPDEASPEWLLINPRIVHDQILRISKELDRGLELVQEIHQDRGSLLEPRSVEHLLDSLKTIHARQKKLDQFMDQSLVVKDGGNARLTSSATRTLIDETEALEIEIGELLETVQELLATTMTGTLAVRDQAVWRMIAVCLTSLLLGMGLSWHVTRSILRPLSTAHRAAVTISRGDLEVHIPQQPEPRDELGHLLSTMNDMAAELRKHRRTENRLMQTEKISSLGRLAIGLAHEINNPLANASMHLELLRLTLGSCHQGLKERLESIERNVSKAIVIAKELLNFSRPDPPAFALLHVHDALECVLSLLDHRLHGIRVRKAFAPDLPRIHGIGGKIEQLFMNLIQNAIEAMPHGGELWVVTHSQPDTITVIIRDSGPGIPVTMRQKVMETFFTTRHEEGGVGLGLTVCQGVLSQHGGTLTLDDAPEGGLAAVVTLPRYKAEDPKIEEEA
ncbi:MAG: HAMP domain-containing protein [Magnetococcales bacterium]|nr:HAMP domain-containing protein [Magnetococcales bacterium]